MSDTSTAPVLSVRLHLPYDRPPKGLSGNARVHWRTKAAATASVRDAVTVLARQAGLHRYAPGDVEHVTVELVWAPGDNRRRDEDNLFPLVKVAADALARGPRKDWTGIDLVPDDTSQWMAKSARVDPPPAPKAMYLDLSLRLSRPSDDTSTENDDAS